MSSEEAADWILRGVSRNKARILVGRDAQIAAFLLRVFPVSYLGFLTWMRRRNERGNRRED